MNYVLNGISVILLLTVVPYSCSYRSTRSNLNDARHLGFKFQNEQKPVLVASGNLLLDCNYTMEKADDIKDVRIEWRKDGSITKSSNNSTQLLSNGSLFITNPTTSDEGSYQCSVRVTLADSSKWVYFDKKVKVIVNDLPRFIEQPETQTAYRGYPVSFQCFTGFSNVPSVVWYHNDAVIRTGGGYQILPIVNSLEISSVQTRHQGIYKCIVEGAGKMRTSQTASLKVLDDLPSSNDITYLAQPLAQSVVEGETLVLECLATSSIAPDVRWLKDSRQLVIDGQRIRRVGISSVLVENVTAADAGLYTCRASNPQNASDITVAVNINAPPHIIPSVQDRIAVETVDVEFDCVVSGKPQPTVTWLKNGEAIIPSDYFVMEHNRLRILGVMRSDQGVYQCLAENEYGSDVVSAQLFVNSAGSSSIAGSSGKPLVPSSPLGIRTLMIGSRVATVEWDPPVQRNGNIVRYHLYFKEENNERERIYNTSSNFATLKELRPDTLYLIKVAAENEAGIGTFSDHIKITTKKEQAVPGKITNLSAKALGPETIEVRWDPPQAGPAALRYKLFYIRNPPGDDEETQTITSASTYTFHGMEKFTEYLIRVEADGENGSGLSSETVSVRTHSDVPRVPPRDVVVEPVSSTSLRVSWKEPVEGINGDITGFRVRYKTKNRGNKAGHTYLIDATEREYTVTGLEKDTQYLVKVAVVNHNGTGEYSDWIPAVTPFQDKEEALLGAPREIRPIPGQNYILLTWLPPADESILVRGYQVGWGHNVPDVSTARVAGNVHQYKITNLRPGKEYVVSLRGLNKHGLGFPIYETIRTQSPASTMIMNDADTTDPSMTPVGLRAETSSATSIHVSWKEPNPNAFNMQYTVRYSTGIDGNQMRSINTSEPWISVEGLRPATEYEFSVRSVTSEGTVGQWSMAAVNRTFAAAPSSAPRDLTVLPAASGDPHSVSLSWQPPKYANGEIEEYLIYYSDRASLPDKDWIINYVPGDRLSHHVSNLLPKATYFFKIQARNEKGYGPLSPTQSFTSSARTKASIQPTAAESPWSELVRILSSRPQYIAAFVAVIVLLFACTLVIIVCLVKRSFTKQSPYGSARKPSNNAQGDLWINHQGETQLRAPPPDYVPETSTFIDRIKSTDSDSSHARYAPINGQTTLSRSYHQSSNSLEGRRQTPQVVYTGSGRHQPIVKMDYNDSPYCSSSAIDSATPPLPTGCIPASSPIVDGYRTVRVPPPGSSPLRSFTQLAGAPPQRTVVVAAERRVPVGRATAQPRVNVSNLFSPYATCSSDTELEKKPLNSDFEMQPTSSQSNLQTADSAEELSKQMHNVDTMIDDIQTFQHNLFST